MLQEKAHLPLCILLLLRCCEFRNQVSWTLELCVKHEYVNNLRVSIYLTVKGRNGGQGLGHSEEAFCTLSAWQCAGGVRYKLIPVPTQNPGTRHSRNSKRFYLQQGGYLMAPALPLSHSPLHPTPATTIWPRTLI